MRISKKIIALKVVKFKQILIFVLVKPAIKKTRAVVVDVGFIVRSALYNIFKLSVLFFVFNKTTKYFFNNVAIMMLCSSTWVIEEIASFSCCCREFAAF